MPTFIKTETVAVYVTFQTEVEADNQSEAVELFEDGHGELLSTEIGENVDMLADDTDVTIKMVDPLPKIPSSIEDYDRAAMAKADRWVPACGGTEVPFSYKNRVYLYVYNPAQHKHGWLDMGTDMLQFDNPTENS